MYAELRFTFTSQGESIKLEVFQPTRHGTCLQLAVSNDPGSDIDFGYMRAAAGHTFPALYEIALMSRQVHARPGHDYTTEKLVLSINRSQYRKLQNLRGKGYKVEVPTNLREARVDVSNIWGLSVHPSPPLSSSRIPPI